MALSPTSMKIHLEALSIGRQYRRTEWLLVEVLQKVDTKKIFKDMGHSSLFVYAVKELELSEGTAYSFTAVARRARNNKSLQSALSRKKLSVSKASRILSVLKEENSEENSGRVDETQ